MKATTLGPLIWRRGKNVRPVSHSHTVNDMHSSWPQFGRFKQRKNLSVRKNVFVTAIILYYLHLKTGFMNFFLKVGLPLSWLDHKQNRFFCLLQHKLYLALSVTGVWENDFWRHPISWSFSSWLSPTVGPLCWDRKSKSNLTPTTSPALSTIIITATTPSPNAFRLITSEIKLCSSLPDLQHCD